MQCSKLDPCLRTFATKLPPCTVGVTLLAFGNGAPDVFASLAAFLGGHGRVGLGAILSAGSFVTAFVVGCVAWAVSPILVDRVTFYRDVGFYLLVVFLFFLLYIGREVYFWQACGLVLLYVGYVCLVIWSEAPKRDRMQTDQNKRRSRRSQSSGSGVSISLSDSQLALKASGGSETDLESMVSNVTNDHLSDAEEGSEHEHEITSSSSNIDISENIPNREDKKAADNPVSDSNERWLMNIMLIVAIRILGDEESRKLVTRMKGSRVLFIRLRKHLQILEHAAGKAWTITKCCLDLARKLTIPLNDGSFEQRRYLVANTFLCPLVILNYLHEFEFVPLDYPVSNLLPFIGVQ